MAPEAGAYGSDRCWSEFSDKAQQPEPMSPRTAIAVLFYMLLAMVLRLTYGTYHPTLLIVLAVSFGTFVGLAVLRRNSEKPIDPATSHGLILSMVFLTFSLMLWFDPLVVTAPEIGVTSGVRLCTTVQLIAAIVLFASQLLRRRLPWVVWPALVIAWAVVPLVRAETIGAAPDPGIDVFVTNTLASDYLLAGKNPYAGDYPDVYEGRYDYQPGFFYWPAYLFWATPFRALLGDVRWAMIAADLLTAAALVVVGRKLNFPATTTAMLPLVWLAHPVSLLVLELAWIDPLLIAGVAVLMACLLSRRWLAVGIVLGIVAATKQYGTLIGVMTMVYVFAHHRDAARRVLLSSAATWSLLMLPFVFLDWRALFDNTIGVYISAAVRPDALSLVAHLQNTFDITLPGGLLLAVYLSAVAGGCWWLAKRKQADLAQWAGMLATVMGTIFLFGKQAFCNYYFVVAFLVLAFVMLSMAGDLATIRRERRASV